MSENPRAAHEERVKLAADLKTASLSGGGLGLALLGLMIPILSVIGVMMCYFGWRSARDEYRTGRVFAVLGMVVGIVGMGLLVVELIARA